MTPNPLLGVLFHWIGGLASASFYVPYRGVRRWSWEVFWLVGGLFSWIFAPWLFASLRTHDLLGVLGATPPRTLLWCWLWGALWGFGGLTFGLTMRYLGMSLGMAVALGLTTVIGTLAPPIFAGQLLTLAATRSGAMTLLGIAITIVGFIVVSSAGRAKERELAGGAGSQSVAEFDFRKGLLIAIFSGVMSSCFAFGLAAGEPIRQLTLAAGTDPLSQGLPVLCVVLLGGFTTNFVWCLLLIRRHRSGAQLLSSSTPLLRNYLLCALGGTAWYFQFFFYTMGESQMGRFGFSSWTLHMASIIIFSTLWGFALSEWKGSAPAIRRRVQLGIALLVASTLVIGYGNYLGV